MSRKVLNLGILFFIFSVCTLQACDTTIELRSAAFFHSSHRFREIYGNVSGSYGIEAGTKLTPCLDGWVNFDWFRKRGHSVGFHDPTTVSIANISFGVKFPYRLTNCLTAYVGVGPSFSRIWLKNKGQFFHERTSRFAVGAVVKTGVNYYITKCIFLDFFADYLYQPNVFKTHVDIGGLKLGVGLGTKF